MPPSKKSKRNALDANLSPVRDTQGCLIGYRFTPGPSQRAKGAKPVSLKDAATGVWLSHAAARAMRDHFVARLANMVTLTEVSLKTGPVNTPIFAPNFPRAALPAQRTLGNIAAALDADLRLKATAGKRSLDTVRFYKTYLAPWLDLSGPDTPITDFTKEEIVEAWDIWTSEGHSLSVCHARHRALQAALALAERVGWIDASPARMLRFERPQPRARKASDAELEALITTADALATTTNDARWTAMATAIIAAVWTAQRQGDLLKCDLTRQLKQHPISQSWHLHFIQNKTGAKVGIPLMPALADRLGNRTTGPMISASASTSTSTSNHWNKHTFRHMFTVLRTKAGVTNLEFRDLRDTAITRLYEAGATAEQIASWSGHTLASVVAILKHYIDHQQGVADDVGDMLAIYAAKKGFRY